MSSSPRRTPRTLLIAAASASALLASSCTAVRDAVVLDDPPDRVSVKGYELDLAYGAGLVPIVETASALPAPIPLGDVEIEMFDLPMLDEFVDTPPRPRGPLVEPPDPCPEPGPGVVAERPITPDVKVMVEPGRYLFKQTGTIELIGLATFPLPPLTTRTVRNVTGSTSQFEYEVEMVTGTRKQVQRFRVVPDDGIDLVGTETTVNGRTISFDPVTPVRVFPLPASENTSFTSAGADPISGQALVVTGTIQRKERVLGCDEVVDGWLVESRWTFSRPAPTQIAAGGVESRVYEYSYAVATQHGGLVVGDHIKTTTPENYGPFQANLDIASAIGSLTPKPEAS